jgi:hypothetical protein
VSLATALSSRYVDRSFFLTQLERRNIHVAIGPQGYLLELVRTNATMRPIDEATQADWDLVEKGHYVSAAGTLNTAMTVFKRTRAAYLPVVKVGGETAPSQIVGRLHEVDAPRAYNKALSDAAEEERSQSDLFNRDLVLCVKRDMSCDRLHPCNRRFIAPPHISKGLGFCDDGIIRRTSFEGANACLIRLIKEGHRQIRFWEIDHRGQIAFDQFDGIFAFANNGTACANAPCACGGACCDMV